MEVSARKKYVNGKKRCSACSVWKQPEEFALDKRRWDKRQPQCRACTANSYQKEAAARRAYQYRKNIWERYGLTIDEYHAMKERGCGICGSTTGRIVIDHNHRNGKVRAALCNSCNSGLGMFHDNPERMRKAAIYIEDWQREHQG